MCSLRMTILTSEKSILWDIKVEWKKNFKSYEKTVGYAPQENRLAEREIQILMGGVRTLLNSKKMDKKLWAEALNTIVYELNRTGTSSIKNKMSYELLFARTIWAILWQETCNSSFESVWKYRLHTCGKRKRKKLDFKSRKEIFVGCSEELKGYKGIQSILSWDRKNEFSSRCYLQRTLKKHKEEDAEDSALLKSEEIIKLDFEEQEAEKEIEDEPQAQEEDQIQPKGCCVFGINCRKSKGMESMNLQQ